MIITIGTTGSGNITIDENKLTDLFDFSGTSVYQLKNIEDDMSITIDGQEEQLKPSLKFSINVKGTETYNGMGYYINVNGAIDFKGIFKSTEDSHAMKYIRNVGVIGNAALDSRASYFLEMGSHDFEIMNSFVEGHLTTFYTSGFGCDCYNINIIDSYSKCYLNNAHTAGFNLTQNFSTSGNTFKIKRCYFAGTFGKNSNVQSGIVYTINNHLQYTIEDCYALCEFNESNQIGIFYAYNYNQSGSAVIKNCYSTCRWDESSDRYTTQPDDLHKWNHSCSGIAYVAGNITNSTLTITNCYTMSNLALLNNKEPNQGKRLILNTNTISIYDGERVNLSNIYVSHKDVSYTDVSDVQLLLDANTQTEINDLLYDSTLLDASSAFVIDTNDENSTTTPINGFLRFFPLLKAFVNNDGVSWRGKLYQNMNSEPRQDVFLNKKTPNSYKNLLVNSTFVDADFEGISSDDYSTNNTVLSLVQNLDSELKTKKDLKYRSNVSLIKELKDFSEYGYDYKYNETNADILSFITPSLTDQTLNQNLNSTENVLSEYQSTYLLVNGQYEFIVGDSSSNFEVAFIHSTSLTGSDDSFSYSGSKYNSYTTRLHQKDDNDNAIDIENVNFHSGKVKLDITDDFGSIDIYVKDVLNEYTFKALGKFKYIQDNAKALQQQRDKLYTKIYNATLLDSNFSADASNQRVYEGMKQIDFLKFNALIEALSKRGVQEFTEVLTILEKERVFLNNEIKNGVKYNLLDILLGEFPSEFLIYNYTKNQIIQECVKMKNDDESLNISERDKYYMRDLIRIYSDTYRIGHKLNGIVYDSSLKGDINNKLLNNSSNNISMMNHDDFIKKNNIYNDISYVDLDNITNLLSYRERLKLFESLHDSELSEYLKRVNTDNVPNLLSLYPPKPDTEMNKIIDREITEVSSKVKFDNYGPNYAFIENAGNILLNYNKRKSEGKKIDNITKTVLFSVDKNGGYSITEDNSIKNAIDGKTLKVQCTSKNGQYYFTALNDSGNNIKYYVFEIEDDEIDHINLKLPTDISHEILFEDISLNEILKPSNNDIKQVYISNDGQAVVMQTLDNIFTSIYNSNSGKWITYDKNSYNSTIKNIIDEDNVAYMKLDRDGSKLYIIDNSTYFWGQSKSYLYIIALSNIGNMTNLYLSYTEMDRNIFAIDDIERTVIYFNNSWNRINIYDIDSGNKVYYLINTSSNIIKNFSVDNGYLIASLLIQDYYMFILFDLTNIDNLASGSTILYKMVSVTVETQSILDNFKLANSSHKYNMDTIVNGDKMYVSIGLTDYNGINFTGYQKVISINLTPALILFPEDVLKFKGKPSEYVGHRTSLGLNSNRLFIQTSKMLAGEQNNQRSELMIYNANEKNITARIPEVPEQVYE